MFENYFCFQLLKFIFTFCNQDYDTVSFPGKSCFMMPITSKTQHSDNNQFESECLDKALNAIKISSKSFEKKKYLKYGHLPLCIINFSDIY